MLIPPPGNRMPLPRTLAALTCLGFTGALGGSFIGAYPPPLWEGEPIPQPLPETGRGVNGSLLRKHRESFVKLLPNGQILPGF